MDESPGNSSQTASLAWASQYHYDTVESLRRYFSLGLPDSSPGFNALPDPSKAVSLSDYIEETGLRSSLALLTLIEAAFRQDYRYRCHKRLKDDLSRAFRAKHKRLRDDQNVSLEKDIFDAWSRHAPGANQLIGELRGAFRFRHWLAHGRYWTPKLGRSYDFEYLYRLADGVYFALPLQGWDEA